jgi:hypothetical protein
VAFFVTSGGTDIAKMTPSLQELAQMKPLAATGFDARELKETRVYEDKLAAFLYEFRLLKPAAARSAAAR